MTQDTKHAPRRAALAAAAIAALLLAGCSSGNIGLVNVPSLLPGRPDASEWMLTVYVTAVVGPFTERSRAVSL